MIDLVNVHLFHDESNLLCHEVSGIHHEIPLTGLFQDPALYSGYRKKALDYTLESYDEFRQSAENGCLFVFGDFNFRLNPDSFLRVRFLRWIRLRTTCI